MIVKQIANITFFFNEDGKGLMKIRNDHDGESIYIDTQIYVEGMNALQAISSKDTVEDDYANKKPKSQAKGGGR